MREIDYRRFEDKGFLDHLGLVGKGASLAVREGDLRRQYLGGVLDVPGLVSGTA